MIQSITGTGPLVALLPLTLDEIENAELIRSTEEADDAFLFKHALVQDTAYTSLMRHDRKRLHRLVAEALEQTYPDRLHEMAPRLAEHFDEAGDTKRALHYFEQAATTAAMQYANQEALAFYTKALDAAEELQTNTRDSLHRARGVIYERIGEFDAARADLEMALRIARQEGDELAEWQSMMDLGFAWLARDYTRAGEYFEKALDLARESGDAARIAQTLNRVGNWYMNNEDVQRAVAHHREALSIFESIADQRGVADTQDLLGMSSLMGSDFRSGLEHFEKAVEIYRTLNDRQGMTASMIAMHLQHTTLQSDMLVLGEPIGTPDDGVESILAMTQELGWRAGEAFSLWVLGEGFVGAGDYGRALDMISRAMELSDQIGHRQWLAASTMVYGAALDDLLERQAARQHLEKALALSKETGSRHWTCVGTGFLASNLIANGEHERALELLDRYVPSNLPTITLGQRQSWTARVELALAKRQGERAEDILEHLIKSAPNMKPGIVIPRLEMLRAQALLLQDRAEEAEEAALTARQRLMEQPQLRLLWRVEMTLARILERLGREEDAESARQRATETVDFLAQSLNDTILRKNFSERAAVLIAGK